MARIFFPLYNPGTNATTIGDNGIFDLAKSFGAVANGSYDNTTAFQNAINAIASGNYAGQGGIIKLPPGVLLVNGALVTTGSANNSQIYMPDRGIQTTGTAAGKGLAITIEGAFSPNWTNSGYLPSVAVPMSGTIIQSGVQGSGVDPAVFGGKGTYTGGITNVDMLFRNVTVRTLSNTAAAGPTLTAVDMRYASTASFQQFTADVDCIGYNTVLPVANTYGIRGVQSGAETYNDYYRTLVLGYRTGYAMGEHANGTQIQTMCCLNGIEFTRSDHDITFGRVCLQWTKNGIVVSPQMPTGGTVRVIINDYDIENISIGKWYDNGVGTANSYHVLDPNGSLLGGCYFNVTTSGVGRDNTKFFKSGGVNFNCSDGEKFPGALAAGGASTSSTPSFALTIGSAPASGLATATITSGADVTYASDRTATTGFTIRSGTGGTIAEQWVIETNPKYESGAGGYVFGSPTGTTDDNRPSLSFIPRQRWVSFYLPSDMAGCLASLRVGPTLVNASIDLSAPEIRNAYLFALLDLGVNWQTTVQTPGYAIRLSNTDTTGTKKLYLPAVAYTATAPSLTAAPVASAPVASASVASAPTYYNSANRTYSPAANWLIETATIYAGGAGKYSTLVGDFYTDVFTGTGVDIGTPVGPTKGLLDVYVDGLLVATASATATAAGSSVTLPVTTGSLRGFTSGSHTIKIINKGGTGGNVGLSDRIQGVA